MKIIIGADMVPTKTNEKEFCDGNIKEIVSERVTDILKTSDFRIFNLEVPLSDQPFPISKFGPNLIAKTSTIHGMKEIGVDLFTIANNHILDHGTKGLYSTMDVLTQNGIRYVGAGKNRNKASEPFYFEKDEIKLGVYACAEHEFSIAADEGAGANPYDPLESFDDVQNIKSNCDYVIVLYHGGKEHYRYPSPELQKVCGKFLKKGADLVVCQHSHCIGCMEQRSEGTIVYGQGNFIFDDKDNEFWNTSLLIEITLDKTSQSISYIPIVKNGNGVDIALNDEADRILSQFYDRSSKLLTPGFVDEEYKKFAEQEIIKYLAVIHGHESLLFKLCNKALRNRLRRYVVRRRYTSKDLLGLKNYIECEAHRELIIKGINEMLK